MSSMRCVPEVLFFALVLGACASTTPTPHGDPDAERRPSPLGATLDFVYGREDNPHFGKVEHFDAVGTATGWRVRSRTEQWFVGHAPLDGGESGSSRRASCSPWEAASKEAQGLLDAHTANGKEDAVIAQLRADLLSPGAPATSDQPGGDDVPKASASMTGEQQEKACEAKP